MRSKRRKQRPEQGMLPFKLGWGGKRKGAGRKKKDESGVPHGKRAPLASRYPVHVTVRMVKGLPNLRTSTTYGSLRQAFMAAEKVGFRVVHFSIMSNHLHFIVEAKDRESLSRGMQGLLIRIARGVNRLANRAGKVFRDRYHDVILRSPRQVRNALIYVLKNAFRHRVQLEQDLDMFSSGPWFEGWQETFDITGRPECPVAAPRTWLLRTGWHEKHGRISVHDRPTRWQAG